MTKLKQVTQSEVYSHWEKVEKISISQRADIVFPLVAYQDLSWSLTQIENSDLSNIFIISSDDWKNEGVCVPNFRLVTAIERYKESSKLTGKFADIKTKENIFISTPGILDTKLILISDRQSGPYTIIEGNKRSIALGSLNKLVSLEVYLGVSPAIKQYVWSRYSY